MYEKSDANKSAGDTNILENDRDLNVRRCKTDWEQNTFPLQRTSSCTVFAIMCHVFDKLTCDYIYSY